ncbi:hypothetical protein BKA93DRAFT_197584 [Sparassis latifolia]
MNDTDYNTPDAATTGPILIQGFLQYLCQGLIFSQGVKFWLRSSEDSILLRFYVGTLVFSSILQTALETYKVWLDVIIRKHWWTTPLHSTEYLLNGVICTLCEVFLIRRCWKLTQKNYYLLFALASLSASTCVANIYLAVRIAQEIGSMNVYEDPLSAGIWAFPLWVYGSLVIAIAVTSILSVCLWRTRTGVNCLDRTVKHIIGITWESAALPCACMILGASLYSSKHVRESTKVRHLDAFFVLITGKLYTLGILRTVNCRKDFRERLASTDLGRHTLSSYQWNQEPLVAAAPVNWTSGSSHGVSPRSRTSDQEISSVDLFDGDVSRFRDSSTDQVSQSRSSSTSNLDGDRYS